MSSNEQTLDSTRFTMAEEDVMPRPVMNSTPRSFSNQRNPNKVIGQPRDALSSFMTDYEETIATLEDEISKYKVDLKDLKSQVFHLVEDNQSLTNDLRESVEARILLATQSLMNPEVEMLRKQVSSLSEAKESVLKMWNIALQEIERLEKELERINMGTDINLLETRIKEIKQEYDKAVESLSLELREAKEHLSKTNDNCLLLKKNLEELKGFNSELKDSVKEKEVEVEEMKKKLLLFQNQTFESEANLIESKKEVESFEGQFKSLQSMNEALENEIKSFQQREIDLEERTMDAIQQAKESMKLAESAVFEKDVAVFREHQAKKEIEGLQLAMDKVVDNAADKTKSVIESVKKKCDEKLKLSEDEIKGLEMELGEKQAKIDRLIREKKLLDTELSSLYKNKEGANNQVLVDELLLKLTAAEIDRDRTLSSLRNLESTLKSANENFQEELKFKDAEISQLREQLSTIQHGFKSTANERLELLSKVSKLQKRCVAQQEENTAFREKLKKDLKYFDTTLREQQEEHKRHVEDRCQTHNDTILELRCLVDAQQKMVHKWKEEVKRLTDKFERELTKMTLELNPLKDEKRRLKKDLEASENRLAQFEEQLHSVTMENMRLNNRVQLLDQLSKVRNQDSS